MFNKKILYITTLLSLSNRVGAMDQPVSTIQSHQAAPYAVTQMEIDSSTEDELVVSKPPTKTQRATKDLSELCIKQALKLKEQLELYLGDATDKSASEVDLEKRIELARTIRTAGTTLLPVLKASITRLEQCVQKEPDSSDVKQMTPETMLLILLINEAVSPWIYKHLSLQDLANLRRTSKAFCNCWDYERRLSFDTIRLCNMFPPLSFEDSISELGNRLPRNYVKMTDGSTTTVTNPIEIILNLQRSTAHPKILALTNHDYTSEQLLKNCSTLSNVQKLHIRDLKFKTKHSITPLCKLTQLKELFLDNCTIKTWPDLTLLKNLKTIRLRLFHNIKNLDYLFTLKNLEELDLNMLYQQRSIEGGIPLKKLKIRDFFNNIPPDKQEAFLKEICSLANL